ncbi:MAG: DUF805 domain-containing protein [Marmoricola sp.]
MDNDPGLTPPPRSGQPVSSSPTPYPPAPRPDWLPPADVTPAQAIRDFWAKSFTYKGRATAAEYNYPLLAFVVVIFVPGLAWKAGAPKTAAEVVGLIVYVAFTVPWLALISRRFHDANRRGWFGLFMFLPFFGFSATEGYLMLARSDARGERFD